MSEEQRIALERYQELKHLSINNIGLACLKNLPSLPKLQILELRENFLTGKDFNIIVETYPNLLKLKLGGNPIKKFEYFDAFSKAEILTLELFNTYLPNTKGYREILFTKIRSLEVIDNTDRDGYHLESDFYNEDTEKEEEEEDAEYNDDNNCQEDEFDEDFSQEEEDFELSMYSENDDPKDILEGKSKKTLKIGGKKFDEKKEVDNIIKDVKEFNKKKKEMKKEAKKVGNNVHSDNDNVSITSSINPNKNKNGNDNLLTNLLGGGKVNKSLNEEISEEEEEMRMIKKIEN